MRLCTELVWEVPGDSEDAICSSEEEESTINLMKAFRTATGTAKQRPKAQSRAATAPRGGQVFH